MHPADADNKPGCPPSDVPDLDTLVAGTVALMTAWAAPCPKARLAPADLQRLLARKVVSNLFFLMQHPQARPALRQSLAQAHARWVGLAQGGTQLPAAMLVAGSDRMH